MTAFCRFGRVFLSLTLLAGMAVALGRPAAAQSCDIPPALPASLDGETLDPLPLASFYGSATTCAWSEASAAALLRAIDRLREQAIDPARLHRDAILRRIPTASVETRAERDLLLTDAAMRYAAIMTIGQIAPGDVDADWDFPRSLADFSAALHSALDTETVAPWLASLQPAEPAYAGLIEVLARYRALQAAGGWQPIAPGPSLHPGKSDPRLPELRARLAAEGDLVAALAESGELFDRDTVAALKRFQQRHGITPDGVLGAGTLTALNLPVETRIDQIAANLERWRWMARALPASRLEVNVAAASLQLLQDGQPVMVMRTIVGDPKHPTPLLVAPASSILINPPWKVPTSIIMKEIRPKLRREPDYLERHDMQWIGDQLVQAPGPNNSLGRLKLEVRDKFDVYLHDTPQRTLFARDRRALSHGCVRLERPVDLAAELLSLRPGWGSQEIEAAIAAGATSRVQLGRTITVVLSYWTAERAEDGSVILRDDIYGRDARLIARLGRGWMQPTSPIPLLEQVASGS